MKKTIITTLLALTLSAACGLAQERNRQGIGGQRPMRGGMRQDMELVADTAITNHMNLTPEQLQQVNDINANYRKQMEEMRSLRNEEGRRLSREDREARMKQINDQKREARQQLRTALGDDLYIQYLEAVLDRPAMLIHAGQRGGQRGGGRGDWGGRPRFEQQGFDQGGFEGF